MNTSRFVIEKSGDAIRFDALDSVRAVGDSATVNHYPYADNHLLNGTNYYRLRMVGRNGLFKYSPVRSVNDTINNVIIGIYPNPVQNGILYINTTVNCQSIRLMDVSGRIHRNSPDPWPCQYPDPPRNPCPGDLSAQRTNRQEQHDP